jgi:hypothetical protein
LRCPHQSTTALQVYVTTRSAARAGQMGGRPACQIEGRNGHG